MASPAAQRREDIVQRLIARHEGEETVYTGCMVNCGGNSSCALKVRLKDGVVAAIEPDDRYHPGVGREDRLLADRDLVQARAQKRGCPMAWVWHKQLYNPDRILHPLLREPGSRRGEPRFRSISWDEALDTLVERMERCKHNYGPYSVMVPYPPNPHASRLFSFWGAGVDSWAMCSMDPETLFLHMMTGRDRYTGDDRNSSSAADMLMDSKLIVLWGFEPTVTHHGPGHQFAWYVKMARERGTPVICIEPRYTVAAEVLADQWIPIKPGTDMAFILGVAYVLFDEGLYNREFVARCIEPQGFDRWRRYVLGLADGAAKTPSWASAVCGVPAETIAQFARLYARSKPTWLWKHWSVARKSYGENSARGAAMLQAMMGYFGVPGGVMPFYLGSWPVPALTGAPYGGSGDYQAPKICRSHKWAQAVLLLDQVRSGQMSETEWRAIVGYKAAPELPIPRDFNPHILWWGGQAHTSSNHLTTGCDATGDQVRAMERMDFIPYLHTTMTPTARYADLILPAIDPMWEGHVLMNNVYGGFATVSYCPGVVKSPGEARPVEWVYTQIANRLGFGKQFNPYYTTDENWWQDWDRFLRDLYQRQVVKSLASQGLEAPPWEEFKEKRFLHLDEMHDRPHVGFTEEVQGRRPFKTPSGKFEFSSGTLEDEGRRGQLQCDHLGRHYQDLANDWRDMQPLAVYQPSIHGMEDSATRKYPLMMLTPHSRYRAHSTFWNVPWLRGDCYRHAVWLSVADASARGIMDGDRVRVHNEKGELVLPAYVTSRIMPGVTVVRQGAWYQEDNGVAPHVLLGDSRSPVTAPHATTLVEVEKTGEHNE
ncbi:MAG: molybdopterin-dependent oxidoreductase [Chloroflexi bacterium]|nr:molybdopterin-dependent oxidoreductase [Chloroflexota bacterium]